MRITIQSVSITVALMSANGVMAADIEAGKDKASSSCAACHGPKGISNNEPYPNLAGQKENYLVKELKNFRDGKRTDPIMSPIAKPLTDEEIENLAAYYSSLTPCHPSQ